MTLDDVFPSTKVLVPPHPINRWIVLRTGISTEQSLVQQLRCQSAQNATWSRRE
jgi:hypothetical protein